MTNKNALAFLSDTESYKKFLSLADKTCTLILVYDDAAGSIPISMFEAINSAKCKVEFKKLPDMPVKDAVHKNIIMAFTLGQLSGEYKNLDILANFPYALPCVNTKSPQKRTRKTPEQKATVIQTPQEAVPVKRTRKKKSSSSYADMTFDEQYDALIAILSTVKGFDAQAGIKKIVDSVNMSLTNNISIDKALSHFFSGATVDTLNNSLKDKWNEITDIIKVLKDKI